MLRSLMAGLWLLFKAALAFALDLQTCPLADEPAVVRLCVGGPQHLQRAVL